jgi:hypothetical protein
MSLIRNRPKLAPTKTKNKIMKTIRYLILAGITLASLCGPHMVWAQTVTPPVVVPHDDKDLHRDLAGAPDGIKTLIVSFDQTRDKYLAQQAVLLAKLRNATTPAERDAIRDQLQTNRQDFLDALKDFRTQLKGDLVALKGKISHAEFLRIIDAAHDAATEGGVNHHKGK